MVMKVPGLAVLALMTAALTATAGQAAEFTVKAVNRPDYKAVFGRVESRDLVPARARIGGTILSLAVEEGSVVKAGDVIGTMGDSGSPGAVHLHFEYWRSGGESDAVDAEPLITRVCGLDKDARPDDDAAAPKPEPVAVTQTATVPRPDASIEGEVFTND